MSALRGYYERWSRLEEDRKAILDDLKELFAEAKGNGFNPKIMRKAFREQSAYEADAGQVDSDRAEVELYLEEIRGGTKVATQVRIARLTPGSDPRPQAEDGGAGVRAEEPAPSVPPALSTTAEAAPPVPEGKGQGNQGSDEAPASAGVSSPVIYGQSEQTARTGDQDFASDGTGVAKPATAAPALVPPAMRIHDHAVSGELPDIPDFLDRRKRLDAA